MLYNKSAVKNKKPVTKRQIELSRKSPFFKLNDEAFNFLENNIVNPKKENKLRAITKISSWINYYTKYDDRHEFKGIRTASQVWKDKKGHCLERGILFYAITSGFGIPTKLLVVKNPKGYDSGSIKDFGIHCFLLFKYKGKKYKADSVEVSPLKKKTEFCLAQQILSKREFTAFCLQDAGEDFAKHEDCDNAWLAFNAALSIDPNNYTIYVSAADTSYKEGNCKKAEKLHKEAIKITPDLTDTYKTYADFLFKIGDLDKAKKVYREAAKRRTEDAQILYSLGKKLYYLGERSLSKEIYKKVFQIQNSKRFKDYFSFGEIEEIKSKLIS